MNDVKLNFQWCMKSGKRRASQYWAYCEEKQSNICKIEFIAPNQMIIIGLSKLVQDENGSVMIASPYENEQYTCFPISQKYTSLPLLLHYTQFKEIEKKDISFELKIISDVEEPVDPNQGSPSTVDFSYNTIFSGDTDSFPFSTLMELKFQRRSKGWFKLEITMKYKDFVLLQSYSDTFIFNNPRMKKAKELNLLTPKQVKFLYLCSQSHDNSKYWKDLARKERLFTEDYISNIFTHAQIFFKNK